MEEEIEGESDGADADTVQTENVDCNLGMECSGTAGDPVLMDQGETDCLGLIEIEALESVFGCSAEVLEAVGEDEEKDCVCEEDDRDKPVCVSESKVSAEPSSLSSPVHVELHRFESLGRSTFSIVPPLAPAPIPIPASTPSPADLQRGAFQSKRSVSVQMPSSLSSSSLSTSLVSHDNALRPLPQSHLPDRRISLSKRPRSDADSYDVKGSDSTPVVMETNAATLPECPSFPPSPPRWRSRYSSQRSGSFRATAASLDKGLCQGKEGEGGGEDEEVDVRWRGALRGGTGACCSCEHRCSCCAHNSWQKQPSTFPYSVDELEGMMRCLKKFCSVLTDMEERLSEDQASVYSSLSLTDREEVRDILELRNAVKQEAGELELQLTDLVHHYDDSFKMKMNRLLDEQSFLCSQLRLLPPAATPTPSHTSTRNVATQCCMLPCSPLTDISEPHLQSSGSTRDLDSRPPLPVLNSTDEGLDGSSTSKSDKLDFVGLLQKLKKSLRHSVNTDLLE
ncbi:uncharacterized protein LOC124470301 isoform X2 [Hypomesus transpacificus]|uniref:uncharacterized protein LOC124470301 isoform X2 n=1 Tax=Hypomesus transpacificus TaxID=137520 RepID=UPI001F0821CA|nr:uncharacterized protein LOC124470301 isoform X2 [Hypomesus transpacificus]XP_046880082.1 uncharacterized protein LOC124470301 isoform X2 [Hypomesus transpacificus]